jgi:uncharacterized protein YbjT (DUF2867 family)
MNDCGRVVTLTRSPIRNMPRLFPSWMPGSLISRSGHLARSGGADQTICALGTTIKKAGSRDAFRRVDFEYPLTIARAALGGGCRHFLLVSAMGADPHSRVFYNRVKGQLEAAILGLGFDRVSIFRPSLLLGDRREFRPGEAAGQVLGRWLRFAIPRRYRPIHARTVAAAMVRIAAVNPAGYRTLTSDAIAEWGTD